MKLAVIESGNIELFEYSLLQNADNVYELQRYAINKEINSLMSFLSKGLMKNAMVYKVTMAFSERVKGDVITKFNKKSVHLMGSLVLELIERLNYVDIKAKFNN